MSKLCRRANHALVVWLQAFFFLSAKRIFMAFKLFYLFDCTVCKATNCVQEKKRSSLYNMYVYLPPAYPASCWLSADDGATPS